MHRLYRDPDLQARFERGILETVRQHQQQFQWSAGDGRRPERCYMVCATPRSGSNLITEALRLAGVAGVPQEYFLFGLSEQDGGVAAPDLMSFSEFLEATLSLGTGPGGVFGVKVMRSCFEALVRQTAAALHCPESPAAQVLSQAFPNVRYVRITRSDKIRQAVSLARAVQSTRWTSRWPPVPGRPLEYDFAQIELFHSMIVRDELAWDRFFEDSGIPSCLVVYEQLAEAYEQTAREVLTYLGLPQPPAHAFDRRELMRLTDAVNDDWVNRFAGEAPRRLEDDVVRERWQIETHGGSLARFDHPSSEPGQVRVTISRLADSLPWQIKLTQERVRIAGGCGYVLSFRARADAPRPIACGIGQAADPWATLGSYVEVDIGTEWKSFECPFIATGTDPGARIFFDLGAGDAAVDIADVVLWDQDHAAPVQ